MWQNYQRPKLCRPGSALTLLALARHILAVWWLIYSTPSMIYVAEKSSGSMLPKNASISWHKSSPLRPVQSQKEDNKMLSWATIEDDLILEEGLRLRPYKCPSGHWTVGVGHRVRRGESVGEITLRQAGEWLADDVACAINAVRAAIGREIYDALPDEKKRALINLAFAVGPSCFAKFSRLVDAVKAGDFLLASTEVLNSKLAIQAPNRAGRIAALLIK
jgi:lysozyme